MQERAARNCRFSILQVADGKGDSTFPNVKNGSGSLIEIHGRRDACIMCSDGGRGQDGAVCMPHVENNTTTSILPPCSCFHHRFPVLWISPGRFPLRHLFPVAAGHGCSKFLQHPFSTFPKSSPLYGRVHRHHCRQEKSLSPSKVFGLLLGSLKQGQITRGREGARGEGGKRSREQMTLEEEKISYMC